MEAAIVLAVDRTYAYARQVITGLPDGTWTFTDHIEGDMEGIGSDLPIICRLTTEGDHATFDVAGPAGQVPVAINATGSFTRAAVLTAFLVTFESPDLELNHGLCEALNIVVPPGSILAGTRPTPRAARGITGFRTIDTVLGVRAQVVPDRVMAAGDGGATMLSVGMEDPDGSSRALVDFLRGAWVVARRPTVRAGSQRPTFWLTTTAGRPARMWHIAPTTRWNVDNQRGPEDSGAVRRGGGGS